MKSNNWAKLVLAACFAVMVSSADAAIKTWDAGGGDGLWETALNWNPDGVPVAGDTANIGNGDLVTMPSINLPAGLAINLTGGSDTKADGGAIRMNGATWMVNSGSDIGGNAWYDLNNGSFTFDDGASVSAGNWEHKGANTFTFNLSASGFTAITPGTLRNGGGATVADSTWIADLANYTGTTGSVVLVDYGSNAAGWTEESFKTATRTVLNVGTFTNSNIRFDAAEVQVILDIIDELPAPPSAPTNTTYVWEEDMSTDPVSSDPAWMVRGGAGNYTVGGGILTMGTGPWNTLLDTTDVTNKWKGIVRLDMTWRSTSVFNGGDGLGAGIWINTDTDAPNYGTIHFDSILETNGTQTVKIFDDYSSVIATLPGFGSGFLDLQAEIRPYEKKLTYEVTDGVMTNAGTLSYSELAANGANNGLGTLFTRGGSAEFDYVKLEVNALPVETFAVVEPTAVDLILNAASETVVTGAVDFVYGASTNVDITSITVSDESHPGSFSVLTATPLTLPGLGSYSTEVSIQYDNTVSNLTDGSMATGLVTIAYKDVDSAVTNEIYVPVSAVVAELFVWTAPAAGNFSASGNWEGNIVPPSGTSTILFDAAKSAKSCYLKSAYTIGTNRSWTADGNIGAFRVGAGGALTIQTGGTLDWVSNGNVELAQDGNNNVNITIYGGAEAKVLRAYPQSNWTHTFVATETAVTTFEVKQQLFLKGDLVVDVSNYDVANGTDLVLFDYGTLAGDGVFSNITVVGGSGTINYTYDQGGGDLAIALTLDVEPYVAWALSYGLDGSNNDPEDINNAEGINNLTCFGYGLDPTTGAAADGALPELGSDVVGLVYVVAQRNDDPSLNFSLLTRDSLAIGDWNTNNTPADYTVGGTLTVGSFDYVTNVINTADDVKFIEPLVTQ